LIGVEGHLILENADAFPLCGVISWKLIKFPAGSKESERPHRQAKPRRLSSLPAESK